MRKHLPSGESWEATLSVSSIKNGHDPLLLQALARVNAIGASINRISWGDTAGVDATLHLIVESAIDDGAGRVRSDLRVR